MSPMLNRLQLRLVALAFIASTLTVGAASAQTYTVTISTTDPLNLGRVASGTSTTNFVINPSTGAVTPGGGGGARIDIASARARVSISCSGTNNQCNNNQVAVRIGSAAGTTGRAGVLSAFTVAMDTAVQTVAPSGSNPINFTIQAIPRNNSRTFWVGATFPINATGTTGSATSGYYVYANRSGQTPTAGDTDTGRADVFGPLSISKTSDLSFGTIVKPTSGSGLIALNASTGARSVGIGIGLASPSPFRAAYNVTGEAGKTFSVSAASFNMTAPTGGSLTVNPTHTAGASMTLTGGAASFFVGGSFTLSSSTPGGAYSGVFPVTVNYN